MDTSYCKEQPKKQEYFEKRKKLKGKEARSGNSRTESNNPDVDDQSRHQGEIVELEIQS
jgi:hypothetical protein